MSFSARVVVVFLMLLAAACGGSGDNENDNGNGGDNSGDVDSELTAITASNAEAFGKSAMEGLSTVTKLQDMMGGMVPEEETSAKQAYLTVLRAKGFKGDVSACAGGGSITYEESEESDGSVLLHVVADHCVDETGASVHGEFTVMIGTWSEFPQDSFEMKMETAQGGVASDECSFVGGMIWRFHSDYGMSAGESVRFVSEYGSTEDGFNGTCKPDEDANLRPNTLVRNDLTYVVSEGGGEVTGTNLVTVHGGFDVPDGSGYVEVVAEDLEYPISEDGDNLFGAVETCPTSGTMKLTGAGNSSLSLYFGDDAPAGFAVQLIGPEGFVAEFETCEAFLSAAK